MLYFMAEMSLPAVTYLLLFHTRHQADCLTPEFCFVGLVGFWWEEKTGAPRSVPVKLLQMASTGFQRHKVKHQKIELLPYRVSHSLSFYASWLVGALLWVGCISQASNMFFWRGEVVGAADILYQNDPNEKVFVDTWECAGEELPDSDCDVL